MTSQHFPRTWMDWNAKIVQRMDRILCEQGKHFPRDYTLADLQSAEEQARVSLNLVHSNHDGCPCEICKENQAVQS